MVEVGINTLQRKISFTINDNKERSVQMDLLQGKFVPFVSGSYTKVKIVGVARK